MGYGFAHVLPCFAWSPTASLRFQPTKRPQVTAQKAKAKAIANKFAPPPANSSPVTTGISNSSTTSVLVHSHSPQNAAPEPPLQPVAHKTTLADWVATASDDEDVNNFYQGEKRQRGGRKKRKKNKEAALLTQHWDDIYDPSRPNNYEDYKHSEEKIREIRDWKDLLYRHKMKRRDSSASGSDDYRPMMNSECFLPMPLNYVLISVAEQFAPPMSFAPPPNINDDDHVPPPPPVDVPNDPTGEDAYMRRLRMNQMEEDDQPPPAPPADIPDDPTGEDAYARRLRLSQTQQTEPAPTLHATLAAGQISRAPVRYNLPTAPEEIPSTEAELQDKLAESEQDTSTDTPRSNRPGQAGFAERLMSKYGWAKGQGLGAQGTGIINPLYAKAEKRKKKSDAEGGGFATPTAMGKILGGNKSKSAQAEEVGKFGAMSEVIRLDGMLDGLDLDEELQRGEGGIMQEIGEECGEKYGSVQRVYIHAAESADEQALVFVAFVSQLSALRAVNALEGRIFNGNQIQARFWPKEKFDAEEYY